MDHTHGMSRLALAVAAPLWLAAPAAATEVDEGPVNLEHDCSEGSLSSHHEEGDGGTALRVLGIYEADTYYDDASVNVVVEADEDTVLVLSAYDPVQWHVTEAHPGSIQRVIVEGDAETQVTAPDFVEVELRETSGSASDWWAPNTRELIERAEIASGLALRSYHGCYRGSSFTLAEGTGPLVPTGEPACEDEEEAMDSGPDASALAASCGSITSESTFCLGRTDFGIAAIGLDSGDVCPVVAVPPDENGGLPTAMAWHGSDVYACEGEWGNLTRISLEDESQQRSFAYCDSVASFAGELLMLPDGSDPANMNQLWAAGNLTEAHCGGHRVIPADLHASRITADGGRVYAATHSTSEVEVFEPPQEGPIRKIQLEGFDTWIHGMAVLDGEALAINATHTEGRIAVFDLHDGELLWEVEVAQEFDGMACMSGTGPAGDDDDDDDDDDTGGTTDPNLEGNDCSCSSVGSRVNAAGVAVALALFIGLVGSRRRIR